MKYILVLSVLFCSLSFADETSKFVKLNKTIEFLQVEQWIQYIRRIKNDEDIPVYFRRKAPSKIQKDILQKYNLTKYQNTLKNKLNELLTEKDLENTIKLLKDPFVIKLLLNLDYNYIEENSIIDYKGEIHPKLRPLIISLYNILDHKSIMMAEYKYYKIKYKDAFQAQEILNNSNNTVNSKNNLQRITLKDFREKYFLSLYNRVSTLTIPELREFIRLVRNEKSFLKYHQVFLAYHYSYVFELRKERDLENQEKRKLGIN